MEYTNYTGKTLLGYYKGRHTFSFINVCILWGSLCLSGNSVLFRWDHWAPPHEQGMQSFYSFTLFCILAAKVLFSHLTLSLPPQLACQLVSFLWCIFNSYLCLPASIIAGRSALVLSYTCGTRWQLLGLLWNSFSSILLPLPISWMASSRMWHWLPSFCPLPPTCLWKS